MISKEDKKRLWVELSIQCSKELEEPLCDFLISELSRGVLVEESPDNEDMLVIKAYLRREDLESGAFQAVETYIEELCLLHPHATVSIEGERIIHEDWHDKWKRFFKPLRVGRRLVVKPTWEDYIPGPDEIVIEMDPGRAFGVGSHASTRLILQKLEKMSDAGLIKNMRVLDVGTGSGILAISAARLGAREVIAIDIDLDAVETARKNVHLNNVHEQVFVSNAPLWEIEGPFDLVLANIDRDSLLLLSKELSAQVASNGLLLLSGILDHQADGIEKGFGNQGLKLVSVVPDEKDSRWILMEFQQGS